MGKIITIDYEGKKLRVDLDTMKATEVFYPKHFFPKMRVIQPARELPRAMIWMTKNLDIDDGEGGITKNPDHPEYGCYYTWEAAKRIADKIPGWHLPTMWEWDILAAMAGGSDVAGKNLKSKNCWEPDAAGEDVFGFAARPAGYYAACFTGVGSNAYFWTASEINSTCAFYRYFCTDASMYSYSHYKYRQYSVRLVKDA